MVGGQTPPLTCTVETPSPHAPTPCSVMVLWASLLGGESAAPCRLTSQQAEQKQVLPGTHRLRVMRLTQDVARVLSPPPSWAHSRPRGAGLYSFKFHPSEVVSAAHSTASREPVWLRPALHDASCCLVRRVKRASLVAQLVKDPPASAGDARAEGSVPGSGGSAGGGKSNPL